MKKLLSLLFLLCLSFANGQTGVIDNNVWNLKGNTIGNNTSFIGTKNARSLILKANSASEDGYLKIDSVGGALTFKVENTDVFSPNTFSIRKWPTLTTYQALYFNQVSYLGTNYSMLGDTNATILNGPKQLLFNTGHRRFMSGTSTFTSGGTILTLDAITNTLNVANAELRHFTIGGSVTNYTPGTTSLNRGVLISAETHSTLGADAATITNDVGMEVNAPTAANGLTQGAAYAIYCKGKQNITTQLSIGSALLDPLARLHLAAGNSTMAAVRFTNQTAVSSPAAGEVYYTTAPGFAFQGNMTTSGNGTIVGTYSVGSTATVGAGIRCVGALSVTTTFSAGTTSTLAGNTRIGSSTAPINALSVTGALDVSTTFSAGTTSTLVGKTRVGGTTAPSATLDVTGNVLATTSILSSGVTSGIGYAAGSGSTVTQGTNRTTGVTINSITGAITLVSAAGSASWQSFVVTNSAVAGTDVIVVNQKSGSDSYLTSVVTVSAGSFRLAFATTGGTTTEQPTFNFAVIKGQSN